MRASSSSSSVAALLLGVILPSDRILVRALFKDETGLSDFLLPTAGHGVRGVTFASPTSDGAAVITSSSFSHPFVPDDESDTGGDDDAGDDPFGWSADRPSPSPGGGGGCYVSSRSAEDGSLLWRRDACSSSASSSSSSGVRHAVFASPASGTVFTLDDAGVFRGWDEGSGALKFDVGPPKTTTDAASFAETTTTTTPRLLGADVVPDGGGSVEAVAVVGTVATLESGDEALVLRDPADGAPAATVDAAAALAEAKVKASAPSGIGKSSGAPKARVLGLVTGGKGTASVVVGWVYAEEEEEAGRSVTSGNNLAVADVALPSQEFGPARPIKVGGDGARLGGTALRASSMRIFSAGGKAHVAAIASAEDEVVTIAFDTPGGDGATARRKALTEMHPLWKDLASIHPPTPTEEGGSGGDGASPLSYIRISGDDDRYPTVRRTVGLFAFDPSTGEIGRQLYEGPGFKALEEETEDESVLRCGEVKIAFTYEAGANGVRAFRMKGEDVVKELTVAGDAVERLPKGGPFREEAFMLNCDSSGVTFLATASGGTTLLLGASFKSDWVALNVRWSAEEALGALSSATFLDEGHTLIQSPDEDEDEALLHSLSFASRLESQLESLRAFASGGVLTALESAIYSTGDSKTMERAFGFSKVAVLLNQRMNVVIGSDMGSRGSLLWTHRLHPYAEWHRVVHGGPSSRSGASGGQDPHALHGHEVLVLSFVPPAEGTAFSGGKAEEGAGTVRWTCLDGLTGRVHAESKVPLGAGGGVAQIVPLHSAHHAAGECRQVAALLHEDDAVSVVPDTDRAREALAETLRAAGRGNGLYAHSVNRATGTLRSLRISDDGAKAVPVGEAVFRPDRERIVGVSYPRRNEVVQSPATILGDDSLLLKYINPHLCVVVTEATPEFLTQIESDEGGADGMDSFYRALGADEKPKPLGATKPGEPSPPEPARALPPSLFINVVDTVSGQVLHRASHSHLPGHDATAVARRPPLSNVPVLISENWIIFAFPNGRTQRTELGVLTLHEGMIDKAGITMVQSPEQDLSFSSLTSPRPIVLSKTYGMQNTVSALGITTTRGGISVKHILAATGPGGSVASIDRRMLDPRRPTGEPKQAEKTEGLMKYFPLVSLTTKMMPSYNLEVAGVTSIDSMAANVESQSMMLAYGGPDIFFTRLSPSRGFDLLPENFNRPLLSVVVVGLLAVVVVLKGMSRKKMVTVGWA